MPAFLTTRACRFFLNIMLESLSTGLPSPYEQRKVGKVGMPPLPGHVITEMMLTIQPLNSVPHH
jgi:hypothetical protein